MKKAWLIPIVASIMVASANGEIEKVATLREPQLCFHWWPKISPPAGWHHEREASLRYESNAFAPDGFNFSSAEAVIYARALYKPREVKYKALAELIASDKDSFSHGEQAALVNEVEDLSTGDGQSLKSITFFPRSKGNWERVTYGEEGEFYLLFTLSARSYEAYKKAQPAYENLVKSYRREP